MPAEKKNFTVTEIKAGILVLASLLVFIMFIAVITKLNLSPPETKQFHTFLNSTLGLNPTAEVRFGGMRAGVVNDIRYARREEAPNAAESNPERLIRVDFEVLSDVPVNAHCLASIEQTTFTSEYHLELSTGSYEAALLEPGATLDSRPQMYGLIELPDTGGALEQIEQLLRDVRTLIGVAEEEGPTQENMQEPLAPEDFQMTRVTAALKTLLEDVDALLGVREAREKEQATGEEFVQLAEVTREVQSALQYLQGPIFEDGNLAEMLHEATALLEELNSTLTENRRPLNATIENAAIISEDVQGIVGELTPQIEGILERLENTLANAEGLSDNAADFLEQNRPAIEDLVFDLNETVRYLREFSRTLAEQPSAVIRGATPQGRKD
ncbi:MAG: MlaD family protein [Candidatus Hydrogenedentota bacterium]